MRSHDDSAGSQGNQRDGNENRLTENWPMLRIVSAGHGAATLYVD